MNTRPVIGANISQTLFKQNESVVPGDSVSSVFQNLTLLSDINSVSQNSENMQSLMPAYLQQAHLSTWFQDNPWETLTYTRKYGVPPMGGNLDTKLPPGYKSGNTLSNAYSSNNLRSNNDTKLQREEFTNEIKIQWR